MKINRKSIFALGIFICFLICISHACAYEGVDNSTSLNNMVDNSHSSDSNIQYSDVLSVSNSDVSNVTPDEQPDQVLSSSVLSQDKLGKSHDDKTEVADNITVGNFSLLNKELSDFNDNRYYKTIVSGREVRKIIDTTQFDQVHTYNLTRDYVYDDSTDKAFIDGISLQISPNRELYDNIIINGNGHCIDGNGMACIFKIFGTNVQICNITFKNFSTLRNYYQEDIYGSKFPSLGTSKSPSKSSPIVWMGNYGRLTNCTFTDNIGSCGGSIFWSGNNGIIEHNKFINNRAAFLGGFAYIGGISNYICDNLVVNCEARLDGDALYVKNLSANCVSAMNYIKVNKTNSTFVCPDVVDGSLLNVDCSELRTGYVSLDYECIDVTPLVYGFLFYSRNYYELENGVKAFATYDNVENVLSLTLSKFASPTIEMRKTLNVNVYNNDLSMIFNKLFTVNGVFQIIKHYTVNNANDYIKANALQASSVISDYNQLKNLDLPDEISNIGSESIMPVLSVEFNKTLSIDSSLSWTPKGFDLIYIDGANSHIHTENNERDEKKFVDWDGDSMFVASNLRVSGFNNAFKNIASQMILKNIEVFGNKMEYIVDRDYGAGILNTGVVYCMNCTFHDNKAKYGAAIYNQGLLVVTNSSFYSNNGYSKGSDIVNVDDGIVSINGKNFKACDGDKLVYMKSLSSTWQTVIKISCYAGSFILGAVAGFFTANPLVGLAVGAAIGAAVGTIGSAVICSNVYDINFCRWSCALTLILGSVSAGATGGQLGGLIGAYNALSSCANTYSVCHSAYVEHADLSSHLMIGYVPGGYESAEMALQTSYNMLCDAVAAYKTAIFAMSAPVFISSTAIITILSAGAAASIICAPGATWAPTVQYTDPDPRNIHSLISDNSNTYTLSSDSISNIKSENVQWVNDLMDNSNNKISFTSDEVLEAISSINLNGGVINSVLY